MSHLTYFCAVLGKSSHVGRWSSISRWWRQNVLRRFSMCTCHIRSVLYTRGKCLCVSRVAWKEIKFDELLAMQDIMSSLRPSRFRCRLYVSILHSKSIWLWKHNAFSWRLRWGIARTCAKTFWCSVVPVTLAACHVHFSTGKKSQCRRTEKVKIWDVLLKKVVIDKEARSGNSAWRTKQHSSQTDPLNFWCGQDNANSPA